MGKKLDWRSLPRKPASAKRKAAVSLKLTDAEAARLRAAAAKAGRTIVDFIVGRCCG